MITISQVLASPFSFTYIFLSLPLFLPTSFKMPLIIQLICINTYQKPHRLSSQAELCYNVSE